MKINKSYSNFMKIIYRRCELCGKKYKVKMKQTAHQKYCSSDGKDSCYYKQKLIKSKEINKLKKVKGIIKPDDKLSRLLGRRVIHR